MFPRTFWQTEIAAAFDARSVVWLSGVRRAGKTELAKSLPGARYFDCELARVRRALEDPEAFFGSHAGHTVVLDEIHRLSNPSEVLKIAADHFPTTKVLATGSSTLAARQKFRDTLTGRKREVRLVPLIWRDVSDFGSEDIERRCLHGGLPPFFLADRLDDKDYEEWVTSYWARDLSELFVVDKRSAFFKLMELLFAQSGGLFEAQSFTAACELSRPTVQHYLEILETTLLVTVVRPYHGGAATEITKQPKVYGFDTGFVAYFRGWEALRDDDRGYMLEHLVLGELVARFGAGRVHYWRDKAKREVDFVLETGRRRETIAIDCKGSASKIDSAPLTAFRTLHPGRRNVVVTWAGAAHRRDKGDLAVEVVPYAAFGAWLDGLR